MTQKTSSERGARTIYLNYFDKGKLLVVLRLVRAVLDSIIRKLPFRLPSVGIVIPVVLLGAFILGFIAKGSLERTLGMLSMLPEGHRLLPLYAPFAITVYFTTAWLLPTIAPSEGRLRYLTRLPISSRILGFCLSSPVMLVLALLILTITPGYVTASAALLSLSYLDALLVLIMIAMVVILHAQLTYGLSAKIAARYNSLGSAINTISAFGYVALLVHVVNEKLIAASGPHGSYGNVIAEYVLLLYQWPVIVEHAVYTPRLTLISVAATMLTTALSIFLLPHVLAPRVNEGFGGTGRSLSRLLMDFPYIVFLLRFLRAPRTRDYMFGFTLFVMVMTVITSVSEQHTRELLTTQVIVLLATMAGVLSAQCSSITTPAAESHEFLLGLPPTKIKVMKFAFGLIYPVGYSVVLGTVALLILNQFSALIFTLIVFSSICAVVGHAFGSVALSRSYFTNSLDMLAWVACIVVLVAVAALGERVGFPLNSLPIGLTVLGVFASVLAAAFAFTLKDELRQST